MQFKSTPLRFLDQMILLLLLLLLILVPLLLLKTVSKITSEPPINISHPSRFNLLNLVAVGQTVSASVEASEKTWGHWAPLA